MVKPPNRVAVAIGVVACLCAAYAYFAGAIVHVSGPAVAGIAQNTSQSVSGMNTSDYGYPARIIGYGESGEHVTEIVAKPNFVFPAFGGELLGSDRGEWGGELVFRDGGGAIHPLINRNVRGIAPMPFGVAVFTGLAHLGMSAGNIYSVARRADGAVAATLIHNLRGSPEAIRWTTSGDLVFQVDIQDPHRRGLFGGQKTRCLLLDRSGALRKQLCAAIVEDPKQTGGRTSR
jgi:hypothetical protein